jgi:hypothetical protein
LARGGAGQELAHGNQGGIFIRTQPFTLFHQLTPVIAQMGDRAAEGGQAQGQKNSENFKQGRLFFFVNKKEAKKTLVI